jgi:hypothetical protein
MVVVMFTVNTFLVLAIQEFLPSLNNKTINHSFSITLLLLKVAHFICLLPNI